MEQKYSYNGLRFKFYAPTTIKSNTEEAWVIRGYAATSDLDRQNDVISPDALKKAAEELKKNTTVFYEHKHDQFPIGRVLDTGVDSKGLWVEVLISKTAKEVWTLIEEGVLNKFSIGGKVLKADSKYDKVSSIGYNYITDLELYEISIVGLPANPKASFSIISGIKKAYLTQEKLQNVLEKLGGEKIMAIEKKDDIKTEPVIEKKEEVIEKKEELKQEETPKVEEKKEEVIEKKEELKVEEPLIEKKEEVIEKKEDSTPAEPIEKKEELKVKQEEPVKEEEPVEEFIDLEVELKALKDALAEILVVVKDIQANMNKKEEPKKEEVKETKLDLTGVEDIIMKALDVKLGKIRLVPSRKGTIIKMDVDLKDEEVKDGVDVILDEEKFNALPKEKQKALVKSFLVNIIKS